MSHIFALSVNGCVYAHLLGVERIILLKRLCTLIASGVSNPKPIPISLVYPYLDEVNHPILLTYKWSHLFLIPDMFGSLCWKSPNCSEKEAHGERIMS